MKNTEIQSPEMFMNWFADQEKVPMSIRHYVLKEFFQFGELSIETAKLVDTWLGFLEETTASRVKKLERDVEWFSKFVDMENNEETSSDSAILHQAETEMMRVALKFKDDFTAMKKQRLDSMESSEHSAELDAVAALRKNLQ